MQACCVAEDGQMSHVYALHNLHDIIGFSFNNEGDGASSETSTIWKEIC